MIELSDIPFKAHVGIDWADRKHEVCVQSADGDEREFDVIPHRVELINEWAYALRERFGSPIAIAVELSKGPIVSAFQKHDFFVIFPVNPTTLAKYRKAFQPSRAKDDPTDAALAVELIRRHPERFKPLRPQSVEMHTLASLVEQRRNLRSGHDSCAGYRQQEHDRALAEAMENPKEKHTILLQSIRLKTNLPDRYLIKCTGMRCTLT